MKQIIANADGWWIVWSSTGSDDLLYRVGPYRWHWWARFRRWWWFR